MKKYKLMYVYDYAGSKFCLFAKVKKSGIIKFKTVSLSPFWKFWAQTDYVPVPKMDIDKTFKELLNPQPLKETK